MKFVSNLYAFSENTNKYLFFRVRNPLIYVRRQFSVIWEINRIFLLDLRVLRSRFMDIPYLDKKLPNQQNLWFKTEFRCFSKNGMVSVDERN